MAEVAENRSSEDAEKAKTKRPYSAPAIAWDEAWNARANLMASCGRIENTGGACDADPSA